MNHEVLSDYSKVRNLLKLYLPPNLMLLIIISTVRYNLQFIIPVLIIYSIELLTNSSESNRLGTKDKGYLSFVLHS